MRAGDDVRRWIAAGAMVGLVLALVATTTMPNRRVHTVYIPAPRGHRVAVYGALAPYAPARFSLPVERESPQIARDALLGLLAGGLAAAALASVGRLRPEGDN